MQITRRQTLQLGAVALTAQTLTGCQTTASHTKPTGYIDAHAHVWSGDLEKYPLGPWATSADMKPATFTDDQLLAIMRPHGLERCVLIQHAPLHGYDNSYILDCARKRPGTFSVVAMINERTPRLQGRLQDLRDEGARGIRVGPTKHADRTLNVDPLHWLKSPGQQLLWQHAAELGIAICPLLGPKFLPSLGPMCEHYPDTTVVIDHFGHIDMQNPETVAALIQLARHRNVCVKVSAFYKFGDKKAPYNDLTPMIERVVDAFGPNRLMWASDLPYQLNDGNTYRDAIWLMKDGLAFLSLDEREAILRGTAERVFFGA
ncbi:MAG: amidohydrolase family protein [Planctomycetota bacterium]